MASTRLTMRLLSLLPAFFASISSVSALPKCKPLLPASVADATYLGCFVDNDVVAGLPHVLPDGTLLSSDLTAAKCAEHCAGYAYFGVEGGSECYCGNAVPTTAAPASECKLPCSGNSKELCGGLFRLNVYAFNTVAATSATEIVSTSSSESTTEPTTSTEDASSSTSASETISTTESSTAVSTSATEVVSTSTTEEASTSSTSASEVVTSTSEVASSSTTEDASSSTSATETVSTTESITTSTSTTEAVSSATTEDVSSSTTESASTTEDVSTSSSVSTTEVVSTSESSAVTTSTSDVVPASTTTDSPGASSSVPSTSFVPSSTTSATSTTPAGPPLTTITSCPAGPTVAGPAQCYQSSLPSSCEKFSSMPANFNSRYLSSSLRQCQLYLTQYGNAPNPTASACFPTSTAANPPDVAAATSTLLSVYSCLRTANVLCTFNADCQTATYTVGQVPAPTQSIGVDVLLDGNFDTGSYRNWSVPQSPNVPTELSTVHDRTAAAGSVGYSYHVKYANINGGSIVLSRVILGIEPGKQYQFKAWLLHDNPSGAVTNFYLYAYPAGGSTPGTEAGLNGVPANTWVQRTITFTASSSWFQLQVSAGGQVSGNTGSAGGVDNIYVDDIQLVRLN
ncbi:WSC domain-containing protein [Bombardia bombarda]|uniref:WSC domain-containing protein n=1 Tax=Bombardia bombarda TaxID=252184 RepID=A0AA40CA27_9PEZI|nr:WSC domain-containing protein [Bombardia bombarda]